MASSIGGDVPAVFEGNSDFYCEQRTKPKYVYRRMFTNDYGTTKVLEIKIEDFSRIYIPETQQWVFKRILSTEVENGKLLPLHQSRPTERCASLTVTTTSAPPLSMEPLKYDKDVERRTQYILLDLDGFRSFLDAMPNFTVNLIPWMERSANGSSQVTKLSPYSTYARTKQLKGNLTLQMFVDVHASLEMSAVMFENSSCVELRYMLAGSPRAGVYLNKELAQFVMDERDILFDVLTDLEGTTPWKQLDMGERRGVATKRERGDDVATEGDGGTDEVDNGPAPRKRVKFMPAEDTEMKTEQPDSQKTL
jgi:hypothetical protein